MTKFKWRFWVMNIMAKDIASHPPILALIKNCWQSFLGLFLCSDIIFPALHLSKSLFLQSTHPASMKWLMAASICFCWTR